MRYPSPSALSLLLASVWEKLAALIRGPRLKLAKVKVRAD